MSIIFSLFPIIITGLELYIGFIIYSTPANCQKDRLIQSILLGCPIKHGNSLPTLSCKEISIRKSQFLPKAQVLCILIIQLIQQNSLLGIIKDLRQQGYISPFQGPSPGDIQSMLRKLPYIVLYLSRQSLSESSPEFADIIYQYPTHNVSKLVQVYGLYHF